MFPFWVVTVSRHSNGHDRGSSGRVRKLLRRTRERNLDGQLFAGSPRRFRQLRHQSFNRAASGNCDDRRVDRLEYVRTEDWKDDSEHLHFYEDCRLDWFDRYWSGIWLEPQQCGLHEFVVASGGEWLESTGGPARSGFVRRFGAGVDSRTRNDRTAIRTIGLEQCHFYCCRS